MRWMAEGAVPAPAAAPGDARVIFGEKGGARSYLNSSLDLWPRLGRSGATDVFKVMVLWISLPCAAAPRLRPLPSVF